MLCHGNKTLNPEVCVEDQTEKPLLSLCLIFFSQFVLGVGTTLYVTLGQPYLDDNTKRKNTPKLLGKIQYILDFNNANLSMYSNSH